MTEKFTLQSYAGAENTRVRKSFLKATKQDIWKLFESGMIGVLYKYHQEDEVFKTYAEMKADAFLEKYLGNEDYWRLLNRFAEDLEKDFVDHKANFTLKKIEAKNCESKTTRILTELEAFGLPLGSLSAEDEKRIFELEDLPDEEYTEALHKLLSEFARTRRNMLRNQD